jgi:hypothetical protein
MESLEAVKASREARRQPAVPLVMGIYEHERSDERESVSHSTSNNNKLVFFSHNSKK